MTTGTGQQAAGTSRKQNFFALSLCAMFFALCAAVQAQPAAKVARVGILSGTSIADNAARIGEFRQALRELGHVEGKNIVIESRYAEGRLDRLTDLANELARRPLDVILTSGPTPTRAAKQATVNIPIVMGFDNDPVGNGFVASLARPGGNITGLSTLHPEISGKRLELLKEVVSGLRRVAVLGTSNVPGNVQALKETENAAGALGINIQYMNVASADEIDATFKAATKGRADAVLALASRVLYVQRKKVADLANKHRLPAVYPESEQVEDGGLMGYGVSIPYLYRRAASYVDRILKGAKPADLPVEQPTKFELVINLKTAKQIGLTIPPNVLARADRVIR
jgi:putative tryptophan/tyrosine transport system substrate-binding protein